jgi:hypothetical protein
MGNRTYWSAPLPALGNVSASPAIASALTDISPQQILVPAGMLEVGTRIRLRAYGEFVTSSPTANLTLDFRMNGAGPPPTALATTPAVLAATAAVAIVNSATVSWPWELEYDGHVRAISLNTGTNGQIFGHGKSYIGASINTFTIAAIPQTTAAKTVQQTATALITSSPQILYVCSTWSATTGVTSFTCEEFTCELLG